MFSLFWTYTWWGQATSDLAALSSIIHTFLCEWTWILMGLLLVYYFIT